MATMRRMIWVKSAHGEFWSCSRCAWAFRPEGPPQGASLDEMMEDFERQRDKEFVAHVCQNEPKVRPET